MNAPDQSEFATALLRKPDGKQGNHQLGIMENKTDRIEQNGVGSSLSFLKPQGKITGTQAETDSPVKFRKSSFVRQRASPVSNSLDIPSLNTSTEPTKTQTINQIGRPVQAQFRLFNFRPEEKVKSKVNLLVAAEVAEL